MELPAALGLCGLAATLVGLALREVRQAYAMKKKGRRLLLALALGAYCLGVFVTGAAIFHLFMG